MVIFVPPISYVFVRLVHWAVVGLYLHDVTSELTYLDPAEDREKFCRQVEEILIATYYII